ncbi:hypothetical protein HYW53_00980 [Candidatus Giovannonibacteria bacterium]|nr:hypothetical protein [Candidatus Giovannonibacteria bacterium]
MAGDIMAVVLILFIVVLAIITVASVWKFLEIKDVIFKAVFSFAVLFIAYLIVVTAARYWEAHSGGTPSQIN